MQRRMSDTCGRVALVSDTVIIKMKGWKLTNQCLREDKCEQEMKNPHPQIKPIYSEQRLVVQCHQVCVQVSFDTLCTYKTTWFHVEPRFDGGG